MWTEPELPDPSMPSSPAFTLYSSPGFEGSISGRAGNVIGLPPGDYYIQAGFTIYDPQGTDQFVCYLYDQTAGPMCSAGGYTASTNAHVTTFNWAGIVGIENFASISAKVVISNISSGAQLQGVWQATTINIIQLF